MNTITVWLPIVLFVLIVACLVVYLRFRSRLLLQSLLENTQMHVVCEDDDDDDEGEWVTIPTPDKIDSRGLDHIADYVARLVQSASPQASLMIASPEGSKACLIRREEGQLKLLEQIHVVPSARIADSPYHSPTGLGRLLLKLVNLPTDAPEPEKELAVRRLFADLAIAADADFVHEYNGYADAMRDLRYPLGDDVGRVTMIIQRLLREVYHVREADGLNFSYME